MKYINYILVAVIFCGWFFFGLWWSEGDFADSSLTNLILLIKEKIAGSLKTEGMDTQWLRQQGLVKQTLTWDANDICEALIWN